MSTTTEERKTLIVSHVRGTYHLSCPCGWRTTVGGKAQATDWARTHDRTHTRSQGPTEEEL